MITTKFITKMSLIVSFIGIVVGGGIWYATSRVLHPTGPIYRFDNARDRADLLELFERERFILTATPDSNYSPEYMIDNMAPNKTPKYQGAMTIDVLRPEGKFAGFVTYFFEEPTRGRILFLAIHPDFRNKGYGKLMIKHAIKALHGRGAQKVVLVTRTFNLPAQKVYETVGFRSVKRDYDEFVHYEFTDFDLLDEK